MTVDGSIASLKVAVTMEAMATPVVPLVGATAVTVGAGPCAVMNDHELTLAKAFPVAPNTPVVTRCRVRLVRRRAAPED